MSIGDVLQRSYLALHQAVYIRSGGAIGHRLVGSPSLLLGTNGRRSGRPRVAALIYARDGATYLLVASNNGQDRPPSWLLNVLADPTVVVQVGRRRAPGTARVLGPDDPDYARLWQLVNDGNHNRYRVYQSRTMRPIPVVVVTPKEPLA